MKISIITVTYNCAKTIERTIKSVISQKYQDLDYIIIDGNSTDGTKEIIERYRDNLSFYISEPDDGIYHAMNKGLKQVKEGYVLFLNGDDFFIDPYVLCNVAKYFNGEDAILIGRVIYGGKKSELINVNSDKSNFLNVFYPHQATFVPVSKYAELGYFDTQYRISADYDWICRAIVNGSLIKAIDVTICVFSLGGASSSFQCIIDEYNISKKYMEIVGDKHLLELRETTIERIKTYFFRNMLNDDKYVNSFRNYFLRNGMSDNEKIQIWGAGYWASSFIHVFRLCNISVEYVFDKKPTKDNIDGIPITTFIEKFFSKLFVSTENYDDEISDFLESKGYKNTIDFWKFHTFRDEMLTYYNQEDKENVIVLTQTDLNIFIQNP